MTSRAIVALFSVSVLSFAATSCTSTPKAVDDKVFSSKSPTEAGNTDMPVPPKDAQYTIYCQQFNSPNHMAEARQAKQILLESTPMKKWYIVHGNDQSTLYYGFYRTVSSTAPEDTDEAKRAQADLAAIHEMQDSQGMRPFATALPVPIDAPDPEANPAWDLTRTTGTWSIEIGAYNGPGRKEAAVESVREARKQGYEAYYYHGPTASSVCIGSWPADAAIEYTPGEQNVSPDTPLLVTPQPLSEAYKKQLGQNVQTASTEFDIVDPTLREQLNAWKEHDVNGQAMMQTVVDPVTKGEKQVLAKPFPVRIPHGDTPPAMAETNLMTPPTGDDLLNPVSPARGMGQLRSLDSK